MNQVRATAVIGTKNRPEALRIAIRSVLANASAHLIVVDQSAGDASMRAVEEFLGDPRFTYVRDDGAGVSRARNIGLRTAKTEVVAFTDDDCEVATDWIETIEAIFSELPEVAVVFCSVRAGPHDASLGFVPTYECRGTRVIHTFAEKSTARGIGAGVAVRRDAALSLGGFDEELGPGARFPACEEGDLAVRALVAGLGVCETDRTFVVHHGFRTWSQGRAHSRRDWTGIGAAYAKPFRAGHWAFAPVPIYELVIKALVPPLHDVLNLRRPQGVARGAHFLRGFALGLLAPMDRDRLLFKAASALPTS